MPKFEVGDMVQMPGYPLTVYVLEFGTCTEADLNGCVCGGETFRFKDPGGHGDDWVHTAEFERAA